MSDTPESSRLDRAVEQWIADQHTGLLQGLHASLDVEAGLREIVLHAQYRTTVSGLSADLDVEAGLAAILPRQPEPESRPHDRGTERVYGTVKWVNAEKGYGYVALDHGQEVFVHFSALQMDGYRSLEVGQRVELEVVEGAQGPVGERVRAL